MSKFPEIIAQKIWLRPDVQNKIAPIKLHNLKIVFTNGVFDILHAGHVSYLAEAAALGDFLVVGINSDDSVKRLGKSPARPLQSEESRAAVMASLGFVGAVVVFNEDTPLELIKSIQPDFLVKGADYQIKDIVGSDFLAESGGKTVTIKLIDGFSTTAIEQKILRENQ